MVPGIPDYSRFIIGFYTSIAVLFDSHLACCLLLLLFLFLFTGTMSGGGNRPIKGRMSSKLQCDVSPQEMNRLEEKLRRDEKALQVSNA